MRRLQVVNIRHLKTNNDKTWKWMETTLIEPEMLCPWCKQTIKSKGRIYRFSMDFILGYIPIVQGGKVQLKRADHPNAIGNRICSGWKGELDNQAQAFLSPSLDHNYGGSGDRAGLLALMKWLKEYFDHGIKDCPKVPDKLLNKLRIV